MNEVVTWISVAAGIASLFSILRFWMTYSDRITKAEASAKTANDTAQEAKKDAHEAIEKNAILAPSFSLYREQVAREYIHRGVIREGEDRLTTATDRLPNRLDPS